MDTAQVFFDFQKELSAKLFTLNLPDLADSAQPQLVAFTDAAYYIEDPILDTSLENLAEVEEAFLADYLEGNTADLATILKKAFSRSKQAPCILCYSVVRN